MSFESRNFPGRYLRNASWRIRPDPNDGSTAFRRATPHSAPARGSGATALESYNNPGAFIRHYNEAGVPGADGRPKPVGHGDGLRADTTWAAIDPAVAQRGGPAMNQAPGRSG